MPATGARYDGIADFYDQAVGDDLTDSVDGALLDLTGDVRGLRVLDLACGQGRVSRELARRGASVVGLDISNELLERARVSEAKQPLGIHYVCGDACAYPVTVASFHTVVCHFGLSDIDHLDLALSTVARALRPSGVFVFSILHPCFPGRGNDAPSSWPTGSGYYSEGWWLANNSGFRGKIGANHRMLSTYLNELAAQGLRSEAFAEPQPTAEWVDAIPSTDSVPVYLVGRCRKT